MPTKLITKIDNGFTPRQKMLGMRKAYDDTIRASSTDQLRLKYPDRTDIEESKSVWVSKAEIDTLLSENYGNGIRIYFACHTESTSTGDTQKYLGLHSVVLVATRDNVNPLNPSTDYSIDLDNESDDPAKANSVTFSAMGTDVLPTCPPRCLQ